LKVKTLVESPTGSLGKGPTVTINFQHNNLPLSHSLEYLTHPPHPQGFILWKETYSAERLNNLPDSLTHLIFSGECFDQYIDKFPPHLIHLKFGGIWFNQPICQQLPHTLQSLVIDSFKFDQSLRFLPPSVKILSRVSIFSSSPSLLFLFSIFAFFYFLFY
jgi:hypothetical protein